MVKPLIAAVFAAAAIAASAQASNVGNRLLALSTGCTSFGPTWAHS